MFVCSLPTKDFVLSTPIRVMDQKISKKCQAYAATSIGEDFFHKQFDPEFTYRNSLIVSGGSDPTIEQTLTAIKQYGLLPMGGGDPLQYRAKDFSKVWGPMNTYSLIRGAMAKGFPVLCGIYWQQDWNVIKDGVINSNFQDYKLFPHAIKVYGQMTINKEVHLMVLNSEGTEVGNHGVFFFGKGSKFMSPYIIEF